VRDLNLLPKAHLHLHFTGSMAPATLRELAQVQGIRLPSALRTASSDGELPPAIMDTRSADDQRGWFRFQRLYDAARSVVTSEATMRRIVDEAVAADKAEGSVRMEMQVDPTSYAKYVGGLTPALEIVLDEAQAASARHGIDVGIIVAASRMRHPLEARTLARLAARYAGNNPGQVSGFGLSNDEHAGDTSTFATAFRLAREAGLASVPHAGELRGPTHVAQVYTDLQPTRLGHGVRTAEDPALLERLVNDGVALEVCPASNVSLGVFANHGEVPLRQLLNAGAMVALSADDPLLFGARLTDQYRIAREVHGMDDVDLANLARGSINASLASPAKKQTWLGEIDQWFAN
jgi:adenosine deaminase